MEGNGNMRYATLEEKQEVCTNVLVDFDLFCKENNITYFISCGTALGAVRHKGFIPWDDDIDVDMHVDDIKKLIDIWDKKGDKNKYFLQTKETDKNVPEVFIRIRKNHTTAIDEKYRHVQMHWGLSLDIFPIYNYPDDKIHILAMNMLYQIARYNSYLPFKLYSLPKFIHKLSTRICIKALKRMKKISDKFPKSLYLYRPDSLSKIKKVPREMYYPQRLLQFDGYQLYGMNQVEKYLEWQYGDYMTPPPEDQRRPYHGGRFFWKDY